MQRFRNDNCPELKRRYSLTRPPINGLPGEERKICSRIESKEDMRTNMEAQKSKEVESGQPD